MNHPTIIQARDLARPVHGTWLGVTKQGRIAILTNYHEDTSAQAIGVCSRGAIVNSWLTLPPDSEETTREFVSRWTSDQSEIKSIGGFSLVCGKVDEPLAIFSNRDDDHPRGTTAASVSFKEDADGTRWVSTARGQTIALSNTWLGDRSWAKVVMGEKLMEEAISTHVASRSGDEEQLIQYLLDVLSLDTLPRLDDEASLDDYIAHLQKSIFVPVIGSMNRLKKHSSLQGLYGTQKQTVILVRFDSTVRYFERTLYEDDSRATQLATRDQSFEFEIER